MNHPMSDGEVIEHLAGRILDGEEVPARMFKAWVEDHITTLLDMWVENWDGYVNDPYGDPECLGYTYTEEGWRFEEEEE